MSPLTEATPRVRFKPWRRGKLMIEHLQARFPDIEFAPAPLLDRGDESGVQLCVRVPPANLLEVLRFLRDDPRCQFEQLSDLTCIDYLNFPKATDRYGVTYSLLSISLGHRLWIKCFVNDPDPKVPSATSIWIGADWMEREVFDMFGVVFTDHPDLRRILTWDGFEAHPLRKDYPLRGRGEREDYDVVVRGSA
ncbi:MAG: NADH-quinone oxidoreductase subunit C [Planctomycetes bacterium]|nr:NADH-quinone oxidoreductase subunit C [Planctomycetota bacterium]